MERLMADRRIESGVVSIHVAIAVDHELLAELMASRLELERDIDVVETHFTAANLTSAIASSRPNVLVIDPRVAAGDLAGTFRDVRRANAATRVVILTGPSGDRLVIEAVEAGCSSFARMDQPFADLLDAIRAAAVGRPHLDTDLVSRLVNRLDRTARPGRPDLTRRELEVLSLVADGVGTSEIATRLGLSVNTVRHHVQSILTKLGVHTKLAAVTHAVREGLISPTGL
jgi:DNA-binding NarL/FixJ family response regulator